MDWASFDKDFWKKNDKNNWLLLIKNRIFCFIAKNISNISHFYSIIIDYFRMQYKNAT